MADRRALVLTGLWLAASAAVLALPACYGRNCDPSVTTFGRQTGEGRLLDTDTWESNPVDGRWLPFPGNRAWVFDLRELGNRVPQIVIPYLSASVDPLRENQNFTVGGGNIAVISGATNGFVTITNSSCADYFLRLVVISNPVPPVASAPGDAGASGATDAATDAPSDAGDGG